MLAASARTPAAHALIAAPIPHHDAAADVATRCVAEVDHSGQGVSCVDGTGSGLWALGSRTRIGVEVFYYAFGWGTSYIS